MTGRRPPACLALASLVALAACDGFLERERSLQLGVQSLVAPATFAPDAPFDVTLTVVTGGCRWFERIAAERSGDQIVLQARGRETTGPDVVCPANIEYEPHAYTVRPPFGDSVAIVVQQPGALEDIRWVVRPIPSITR